MTRNFTPKVYGCIVKITYNDLIMSFTEFWYLLPFQDIQLCFICKYHRCDITSHNEFSEKYSFLDEYVSKKLKNCPCICINLITGN